MVLRRAKKLLALRVFGDSDLMEEDSSSGPHQEAASALWSHVKRDSEANAQTTESAAGSPYTQRVEQQIAQYASEPIHDLPEIFHLWSHNFIGPGLLEVFGVPTINEFYVEAVREASADFARPCRILSVGCGDGTVEVELAKSLLDRGVGNFRLEGADLSPLLIERFEVSVRENDLDQQVFPRVVDLNEASLLEPYDVIMANHSLHHMVDLEKLFDLIKDSLADEGIFVAADMIGRNGHMRWPETEAILQAIWPLLSEKQRFHHQLLQLQRDRFENFDCSQEGFEGIRAQDILYLILNRFSAYKFFGYGGFIDVLVDRGFGHGFDINSDGDRALITALAQMNDMMLDAGMIKPTVMMAFFTKNDRGEKYFRTRSAANSVRMPYQEPIWPKFYQH